jgi:hypothetical protein
LVRLTYQLRPKFNQRVLPCAHPTESRGSAQRALHIQYTQHTKHTQQIQHTQHPEAHPDSMAVVLYL